MRNSDENGKVERQTSEFRAPTSDTPPSQPLRLLVVEDSARDAELVIREIKRGGFDVTWRRVENEADMKAALDAEPWDAVISDYRLPHFDGRLALRVLQEKGLDIPFIIVSGTIGEETAVAAMKAGAHDYLMKNNLARLASSVERELREAAIRIECKQAEQAEVRLMAVLDAMPGCFVGFADAKDTHILFINSAGRKMVGVQAQEDVTQLKIADVHPEWTNKLFRDEIIPTAIRDGRWTGECAFLNRDGREILVMMILLAHKSPSGEVERFSTISIDITERKRADAYGEMGREVLQILNEPGELQDSIQRVLAALKTRTGFDAVGIRLQDGGDFPYFVQEGFSKDFLLTENTLIERGADGGVCRDKDGNARLECTCGLVISGKTDPTHPLFTRGGSFWTNDSFPLFDLPSDQDPRVHPRNQCIHQGYASVALVPIRNKDRIVGLIHLNDRRKGCFTLETVELMEGIATHIGATLMRKRVEVALRDSEGLLQRIFDILPVGLWFTNKAGKLLRGNPAGVEIWGAEPLVDLSEYGIFKARRLPSGAKVSPDDWALAHTIRDRVTIVDELLEIDAFDGKKKTILNYTAPVLDAQGDILGAIVVNQDITERKQTEAVLSFLAQYNSEAPGAEFFAALARYLAENLGEDFVCIDRLESDGLTARTVAVWCDGKFEDNVTYALKDTPCGEVVGKTVCCFPANVCQFFPRDTVLKDLRAESYVGVTLWSHSGQPIGLIAMIGRRPLTNRPLAEAMLSLVAVRAAGELERKLVEENLASERRLLRTVIDNLPDAICAKDLEGRKTLANRADLANIGVASEADVLGKGATDLFPPEVAARFMADDLAVMQTGKLLLNAEELLVDANGNRRWLLRSTIPLRDLAGHVVGLVGIAHDITERKRAAAEHDKLEVQFRQAQKMEAVGRLAGGVAHDFNNLLMGIMGCAELCRDGIEPGHPIREWLDEITLGAQRSADLTRQLLAFARKQTIAPRILDLNDAVESMLKLLRQLIGEDINLAWLPVVRLGRVKIDPSQVDQILANLCVNARDAIAGVGKITLETRNVAIDADYCVEHAEAIPGEYVLLAVSDDGCGMDKETLAQVFEPFFTTKGIGKGTGLGLATVYGIVKQNNGFIYAYSEPGKGTTFEIYLPQVAAEAVETIVDSKAEAPKGRGETILLVEDEKSLSVLCGRFLDTLGYKVLLAETPGEALKMVDRHPGDIHLLLTDVVMPGMDGRQLAKRLRALKPGVKVLFMSGYTADVITQGGALGPDTAFIGKPFTRDDLARKVRDVLETREAGREEARQFV